MRRIFILVLLLGVVHSGFAQDLFLREFPMPQGYVNDFAGVFSADKKTALDQKLQNIEKQSGNEIAIATVKSLEGIPVDDFAVRVFEQWKIGKKGKDNGLLILVAPNDKEVRIEVGYGLEPVITDGRAGEIIRNSMIPEFKNNNYAGGIEKGIADIETYMQGAIPESASQGRPSVSVSDTLGLIFFFIVFAGTYLASFLARSKSFWLGGVMGAGVGGILGLIAKSALLGGIASIFLGIFGLLFDFILSRAYSDRKGKGLPTDFWSSRGGFWGGGSFGGGGGFGGFGGGMSGGGGASGRW